MLIKIKNYKVTANIGIYDWEKNVNRELIINAEIETDYLASFQSDDISDTIDYDSIYSKIKNYFKSSKVKLIEKIAGDLINLIMEDQRIKRCKLEVDKMRVFEDIDSFSVTVEQTQNPKNFSKKIAVE